MHLYLLIFVVIRNIVVDPWERMSYKNNIKYHLKDRNCYKKALPCSVLVNNKKERKGKEAFLYSAFYILCISQSAQAWITQFYLQIHHACLSFVCVHQMALPLTEVRDI